MSVTVRRCLSCDSINSVNAKFCGECGAKLSDEPTPLPRERPSSPSFGTVLATVWKVLMAILLIPFLILLGYISLSILGTGHQTDVISVAFLVLVVCGVVWIRRR